MTKILEAPKNDNKYLVTIGILSVAIPLVVAILLFIPQTGKLGDLDVSFLPFLNAVLNSSTALLLVAGYGFIKKRNKNLHRTMMLAAFALSSLFLVSYVIYHFQAPSTRFGDLNGDGIVDATEIAQAGATRIVYLVLLLTHIVTAAIIVPFVLLSIYFGLSNQVDKHRKISKWTYPLWLYVAVTGVIVYLMISPYYAH